MLCILFSKKRQTFKKIISTNTFYIIQQVVMLTVMLRCRWFQTVWYRTTTITTITMQVTWFPLTWRTWEFVLKNIIWTHLTCSRLADLIYCKVHVSSTCIIIIIVLLKYTLFCSLLLWFLFIIIYIQSLFSHLHCAFQKLLFFK